MANTEDGVFYTALRGTTMFYTVSVPTLTLVNLCASITYFRARHCFPIAEQRPLQVLALAWIANMWAVWYMFRWLVEAGPYFNIHIGNSDIYQHPAGYTCGISVPWHVFEMTIKFFFMARCTQLVLRHLEVHAMLTGNTAEPLSDMLSVTRRGYRAGSIDTTSQTARHDTKHPQLAADSFRSSFGTIDLPDGVLEDSLKAVGKVGQTFRRYRLYANILFLCLWFVFCVGGIAVFFVLTDWQFEKASGLEMGAEVDKASNLLSLVASLLLPLVSLACAVALRTVAFNDTTWLTRQFHLTAAWLSAWALACSAAVWTIYNVGESASEATLLSLVCIIRFVPIATFSFLLAVLIVYPCVMARRYSKLGGNPFTDREFQEFLRDRTRRQQFREYLASEFAAENLYFWEAVEAYRAKAFSCNGDADRLRPIAQLLYDTYISSGSVYEVNLPAAVVAPTTKILLTQSTPFASEEAQTSNELSPGHNNDSTAVVTTAIPPGGFGRAADEKTFKSASVSELKGGKTAFVERMYSQPMGILSLDEPPNQIQRRISDNSLPGVPDMIRLFDLAQGHICHLMHSDSFMRYQARCDVQRRTSTRRTLRSHSMGV